MSFFIVILQAILIVAILASITIALIFILPFVLAALEMAMDKLDEINGRDRGGSE